MRRFSLNAYSNKTQGAGQRTASMPRGLAAAFIVFAFIVCFSLGEQQQGLLSSCTVRQQVKRQQYCDER